ncbi:MAG TPA: hypothetical protein VEF34_17340 [Syntrophobacteraceae bacterium]|nr:hypothetical protein [Syntrophobacteraceae bacterium]
MKAKSSLVIVGLAVAFLTIVGVTSAQAQSCCYLDVLAAPVVAAGTIVEGAVVVSAAIVTAPFTALSCGNCGISFCNPCASPKVSWTPGNPGQF